MSAQVSIVVPAFNAQKYLAITIESVLSQTFRNWELVVVDDGSTDTTADIIRRYQQRDSRIRGLFQANTGVSTARNNGRAECNRSVPYIIFLDQDDVWEPDLLQKLTDCIVSVQEAVAAYGVSRFIDRDGNRTKIGHCENNCRQRPTFNGKVVASLPLDQPSVFGTFIVGCVMPTPGSVLFKRDAFDRIGGFDPYDNQCQDWDVYIRLSRLGPFQFLNEVVLNYRLHDSNVSMNRSDQRKKMAALLRRSIKSPDNSPEQQVVASKSFRAAQRYFLTDKLRYFIRAVLRGSASDAITQVKPAIGSVVRLISGQP